MDTPRIKRLKELELFGRDDLWPLRDIWLNTTSQQIENIKEDRALSQIYPGEQAAMPGEEYMKGKFKVSGPLVTCWEGQQKEETNLWPLEDLIPLKDPKKYPLNIGIFGAASSDISRKKQKLCYAIGREIARAGHNLIYGAGSTGVMGAVAKGYLSEKPATKPFGSTTKYIGEIEEHLGADEINLITRSCLAEREELYKLADIIIALPGGAGTAAELERFRVYKQLAQMCQDKGKPVRTWNGELYLFESGTWKETVAKWEAEWVQKMAPHWDNFVTLIDFKQFKDIIGE